MASIWVCGLYTQYSSLQNLKTKTTLDPLFYDGQDIALLNICVRPSWELKLTVLTLQCLCWSIIGTERDNFCLFMFIWNHQGVLTNGSKSRTQYGSCTVADPGIYTFWRRWARLIIKLHWPMVWSKLALDYYVNFLVNVCFDRVFKNHWHRWNQSEKS